MTKLERLVVKSGVAEPLTPDGETADGKYAPPIGAEIVVIPWSWRGLLGSRRVALYPYNSPKAWPLGVGAETPTQPGAFTHAQAKVLYGPVLPSLFQRALFAMLEKWRNADKALVLMQALTLLGEVILGYMTWKLGRFAGAW